MRSVSSPPRTSRRHRSEMIEASGSCPVSEAGLRASMENRVSEERTSFRGRLIDARQAEAHS